ncbi:hypothetical protein P9112_014245 [Eukaryota sp. TZLM1-RC]
MTQIVAALEIAGALLLILSLGFILGFLHILKLKAMIALNFFVNMIGLPALVFISLAPSDITGRAIPVILTVISATLVMLILFTIIHFTVHRFTSAGFAAIALTTTFGSNAVLGRPLVQALFPDDPPFFNEFVVYTLLPGLVFVIPLAIFLFELNNIDIVPRGPPVRASPSDSPHHSNKEIQTDQVGSQSVGGTTTAPHKEHLLPEVDEAMEIQEEEYYPIHHVHVSPGHPVEAPDGVPEHGGKEAVKKASLKTALSPLFLASVIAFPIALLNITLPLTITFFFSSLAATATPVGLFVVGLSLGLFDWLGRRIGYISVLAYVLGKQVLFPLLTLPFALLFGLSGPETRVVLIYSASPASTAAFTLARFYSNKEEDHSVEVAPAMAIQMLLIFLFIWIYIILLDAFNWFVT